MTDDESQNPTLDRSAKRRREDFDEHAAGTGNSTLWDKEPPVVDDGSADGSPLVLPQKEDKGSGGNEDSDVEEVSATEEDSDPADFIIDCGGGVDEGDYFGYCELCVDNEVCKACGNKDGSPVREEECLNPLECRICGTSEHRTENCASRLMNKWGKEQEEGEKMMLSRSGESGQVPKPAKPRRKDEIPTHDVSKSPKQTKRRREELDERTAGTGNSTSWDKEPPMVDDGSADGSPLVLQQKEDKGSGAKEDSDVEEVEDSDVEEVSATEEDYDSPDFMADYIGGVDDGDYCGYCELCVDNEVCKGYGNKDGIPAGEEERFNPLECRICGTSEHRTEYCASRQFNKLLKEEEEREKMMLSRSRDCGGSGDSGYVVPPAV